MTSQTDYPNAPANGISLATVTVGVVTAVFFLLISSYVSNDTDWTITSDRAWMTTGLTGDEIQGRKAVIKPLTAEKAQNIKIQSQNDEAAHFSDALYSADFMSAIAEPT